MTGLVLCGGESLRMGTDKGTTRTAHKTWASLAQTTLQSFHLPVKFSVNESQQSSYSELFNAENLLLDERTLKIGGPLKGILSAHLSAPAEDFFVLACDLIKMEGGPISNILAEAQLNKDFEAYVFANGQHYEPLCGIYKAGGLAKILQLYADGGLRNASMQSVLSHLKTRQLPIPENEEGCFKNFNTPADLDHLT